MISVIQTRLRHAALATRNELGCVLDDIRLFGRHHNGRHAFRHSRIDGLDLLVRADEEIGREIYFLRQFEREEHAYILANVRETDICVDVGANIGFYTLQLARKVIAGQVHAFEPVALNYHLLAANVLANDLDNVIVNHCAVGNAIGEVDLFVAEDAAFSSLVDTRRKAITAKTKVRMVDLDSYSKDRNLPRIDVLKVDVEGAESKVIDGASGLLGDRRRRPRIVMLELYDPMLQQFGSSLEKIDQEMVRYGYSSYVLIKNKLVRFAHEHYNRFYNVVFLRSEP